MKELKKLLIEKARKGDFKDEKMASAMDDVLKEADDMVSEKKMKKLTVIAPDDKSLMEGLEKAEDMLEEKMPESEEEPSEDEMDAMIEKMKKLKMSK
jgi:hypothetical protein